MTRAGCTREPAFALLVLALGVGACGDATPITPFGLGVRILVAFAVFVFSAAIVFAALDALLRSSPRLRPAVRLTLTAGKGVTVENRIPISGSYAEVILTPTDDGGRIAPIENPSATLADPAFADVEIDAKPDGSYLVKITPRADAVPGSTTLQVSADAQIGEGETLLVASMDLTFIAGMATHIALGNLTIKPLVTA